MGEPNTRSTGMEKDRPLSINSPPFLSGARGQAFDLLSHLSLNLPQPILVAGPAGVGRTYYLRALEKQVVSFATPCYVGSNSGMSLERLLDFVRLKAEIELQTADSLQTSTPNDVHSLLEMYARNRRSLLLLLDDAESLLPGFLDALSQYAASHPALQLIVALKDSAILDKKISDAAFINEAFVVDIPPLDRTSCTAYVRQLVAASPAFLPGETLSAPLLDQIFVATRGIPGRISDYLEQPRLKVSETTGSTVNVWALAGTGLLIALIAGLTLYFGHGFESGSESLSSKTPVTQPDAGVTTAKPLPTIEPQTVVNKPALDDSALNAPKSEPPIPAEKAISQPPKEVQNPPSVTANTVQVDTTPPVIPERPASAPVSVAEPAKSLQPEPQPLPTTSLPEQSHEPERPTSQQEVSKPAAEATLTAKLPVAIAPQPIGGIGHEDWLRTQKPDSYTLQVATVPDARQVEQVVADFPAGHDWSSFHLHQGKRELYPVFQGIYPNRAAALEALAQWPGAAKKAIIRTFESIQQELARNVEPQPAPVPAMPAVQTAAPTDVITPRRPVTSTPHRPLATRPTPRLSVGQQPTTLPTDNTETNGPIPESAPQLEAQGQADHSNSDNVVNIEPLPKQEELKVEETHEGEESTPIEDQEQEQGQEDRPQNGEIYYRLVEGQPPIVEIQEPSPPVRPSTSPMAPPVQSTQSTAPVAAQTPEIHDAAWLLAQPPESYTLQLITLSSMQARDQMARQFAPNTVLASWAIRRGNVTLFPVFYGSYPDLSAATRAAAALPGTLGKPLFRQFKTIQREIVRQSSSPSGTLR